MKGLSGAEIGVVALAVIVIIIGGVFLGMYHPATHKVITQTSSMTMYSSTTTSSTASSSSTTTTTNTTTTTSSSSSTTSSSSSGYVWG